MRHNLFVGVNEIRVKILPLLCRLGLVLRLGSVYFDVIGISFLVSKLHRFLGIGIWRNGIRRNGVEPYNLFAYVRLAAVRSVPSGLASSAGFVSRPGHLALLVGVAMWL